jgi:hypothetical protein
MDYTAVGDITHLAARLQQMPSFGTGSLFGRARSGILLPTPRTAHRGLIRSPR